IGVVTAIVTARTISRPIVKVMERMNQVAEGQLKFDSLVTNAKDETASLMDATNQMTANNRTLIQRIKDVAETASDQSMELTRNANEVRAGNEQIAVTMQELASGAEVQANSASELTNVMSDFTSKLSQANEQSGHVHTNSEEIAKMTEEGRTLMRSSSKQM